MNNTSRLLLGNKLEPHLVNLSVKEKEKIINQANVLHISLVAKALNESPEYRKLIGLPPLDISDSSEKNNLCPLDKLKLL